MGLGPPNTPPPLPTRSCYGVFLLARAAVTVSPPTASRPFLLRPPLRLRRLVRRPRPQLPGGLAVLEGDGLSAPKGRSIGSRGGCWCRGTVALAVIFRMGGGPKAGGAFNGGGHRAKVHSVRGTAAPPTPPTGGDRVGRGRWGEGGQGKEKDESEQRVCVCGHRFGVSLGGWNVSKNAVSKDHAEQTIRTRLEPAKDKRKIFVWMVRTIPPSW